MLDCWIIFVHIIVIILILIRTSNIRFQYFGQISFGRHCYKTNSPLLFHFQVLVGRSDYKVKS